MSADAALRAALAALADQLALRREQILSAWAAAIDSDPELSSFSTLSRTQFNDHMPAVLDDFEQRLRAYPVLESAQSHPGLLESVIPARAPQPPAVSANPFPAMTQS